MYTYTYSIIQFILNIIVIQYILNSIFVAFKGSSNKLLQFNQDENKQALGSELKRKNSGNLYFKCDTPHYEK